MRFAPIFAAVLLLATAVPAFAEDDHEGENRGNSESSYVSSQSLPAPATGWISFAVLGLGVAGSLAMRWRTASAR